MDSLHQHPWYVLTQAINQRFQEEQSASCLGRFANGVKCIYVYIRYRKDRLDYKRCLKEFAAQPAPAET